MKDGRHGVGNQQFMATVPNFAIGHAEP